MIKNSRMPEGRVHRHSRGTKIPAEPSPRYYEEVGRLFDSSRLSEIIREEQKAGMLNDIEPYALFHMFLKSTVGLITAYLEAGLQLPDEKVFLYILGYKDEEKLREYTSAKKVL